MIYPVILCGGSGTRLWPVSRKAMPKQFIQLFGETTLLQQAAQRCSGPSFGGPIVITSEDYRFIVLQQLQEIGIEPSCILLEPEGKNTAPAILVATHFVYEIDPNAVMVVMPSDHFIPENSLFVEMLLDAKLTAQREKIVTFGVLPNKPETAYGYIKKGLCGHTTGGFEVEGFFEKPSLNVAEEFLEDGNFLWNAGIFMAKASTFKSAGEAFAPGTTLSTLEAYSEALSDLDFLRLDEKRWAETDSISFDYAVLEKAENIVVFPFTGHWSDLGDWNALFEEYNKSKYPNKDNGNILRGQSCSIKSKNCLFWNTDDEKLLVGVGLQDIIAVSTADAVLVVDKNETQSVKQAVEILNKNQIRQGEKHTKSYRVWGWFETLISSVHYQVRRVLVYPEGRMSLQAHEFRSEHWVVIEGRASLLVDGEKLTLSANESFYVHPGVKHRLANEGEEQLVLIEIHTGVSLNEQDVRRFDG